MATVTHILQKMEAGDPLAAGELLPLVYDELRQLAAAQMAREKPGHTLQATALVHEAYLKLVGQDEHATFANRRYFFGAAAEAMRRILIDAARRKRRGKHGGDWQRAEMLSHDLVEPQCDERLLALNEALDRFSAHAPDKAELLKLRWFGGLSLDQAAALIGISPSTADRWWSYARAWLKVEIEKQDTSD